MSPRPSIHVRGTVNELGYERPVCVDCGSSWPCVEFVKERCIALYLDHGIPCQCGHHEVDARACEKVAQDPEQQKVRVG